jgi:hypothetical protein
VKIKIYSWILAVAYLACGALFCLLLFKFQQIFSGLAVEWPIMTWLMLAVGPVGWLCSFLAVGLFVILKDRRFRSPILNPLFTILLMLWVISMMIGLLLPLMNVTYGIH